MWYLVFDGLFLGREGGGAGVSLGGSFLVS